MYSHVARAFVDRRLAANPKAFDPFPGTAPGGEGGGGGTFGGTAPVDSRGAPIAWRSGVPAPRQHGKLGEATAGFVRDLGVVDQDRAAFAAAPPARQRAPGDPLRSEVGKESEFAGPPEESAPSGLPINRSQQRLAGNVIPFAVATRSLRWAATDEDDPPHVERIKRAIALARRQREEATASATAAWAKPALSESRLELPPQACSEPSHQPRPEPLPDLAPLPPRGRKPTNLAVWLGLGGLVAAGTALWLVMARQLELEQLSTSLAGGGWPLTEAVPAAGHVDAMHALAGQVDLMRERLAALEQSATSSSRDAARAAAVASRLAALEAVLKELQYAAAPPPSDPAPATVAPAGVPGTQPPTVPASADLPDATAPPRSVPRPSAAGRPAPQPTPPRPAAALSPPAKPEVAAPSSLMAAAAETTASSIVKDALLPSANPASLLRDLGSPMLLIDPIQPNDKLAPKIAFAVWDELARSGDRHADFASYQAEFTTKDVAKQQWVFGSALEVAKIAAEAPGADREFREPFVSLDGEMGGYLVRDRPHLQDVEGDRRHGGSTEGSVAGMGSSPGALLDVSDNIQQPGVSDRDTDGSADRITTSYYANAGYWPAYETEVRGTVGVSDADHSAYGAEGAGWDVLVDADFVPASSRVSYTRYADHGDDPTAEWNQEYGHSYAGGDVRWLINRFGSEETSLSLGLFYVDYVDRLYADSNESEVTVWLRLRHEFDFGARRRH